jgi:ribose transport system ATP-binding protein
VRRFIDKLRVKTPGPAMRVGNLSGGNQQKCLLGRQLIARSRILLVDEPTRGVDVGARREIYDLLTGLARTEDLAILMVSSDMPEVLGLCDRIYVMREGRITAELPGASATEHDIMTHAAQ